jgi:hypothetical protein
MMLITVQFSPAFCNFSFGSRYFLPHYYPSLNFEKVVVTLAIAAIAYCPYYVNFKVKLYKGKWR